MWEFTTAIGSGSTVYCAELLAIRKALEHGVANADSMIFCNNRDAVIRIGARHSGDPDISSIQELTASRRITVVWIPGHRDNLGNERANFLAQSAPDDEIKAPADHREEAGVRLAIHRKTVQAWK